MIVSPVVLVQNIIVVAVVTKQSYLRDGTYTYVLEILNLGLSTYVVPGQTVEAGWARRTSPSGSVIVTDPLLYNVDVDINHHHHSSSFSSSLRWPGVATRPAEFSQTRFTHLSFIDTYW